MLSEKKPNFFIVGAPKCGTTALAHYLSAHPDIYVVRKEMHFFGSDLRFSNQFYRRDRSAYLAEFGTCKDEPLIGEASVWYLFSHFAADEIKAFNPEARIIIMLRNPVPLLHSLYCAFSADGNEHLPTFREALAAEGERQLGLEIGRQAYLPQALVYRKTVRFTEQVRRYFKVFGRDRVQVIIYDDFSSNTAEVYRKTLEFLGAATKVAPPSFVPVNANVNGNQSVKSPTMRAILNDPFVRGAALTLRGWLPGPVFSMMQKAGVRLNASNIITTQQKRAPLEQDLELSLRREFAPEIERLSVLLGRDLTHWSGAEAKSAGWRESMARQFDPQQVEAVA